MHHITMNCRISFYTLCLPLAVLTGMLGMGCKTAAPPPEVYLLTANMYERCMQVLRAGLNDEEPWTAIHAAEALTGARYGFEVRPVMLDALAVVGDAPVRAGLLGELVRSGDIDSILLLQDILLEPEAEAHVEAARALFEIGIIADVALLEDAMREGRDERVRLYAAAALTRVEVLDASEFIRSRLAWDDPVVRSTAADILRVIGRARDLQALREAREAAAFDFERAYIARALAVLGDEAARAELLAQLRAVDPVVRADAAHAAADAWLLEGTSRLYALLDDPDAAVRVRAAHALLTLSNPEAPARARRMGVAQDRSPSRREGG